MPTWKSKICRGMDVVETITFTRQDTDKNENPIFVSGVHVPSEQKIREEWTQAEIDAIGETVAPSLDAELARLKGNPIELPQGA
jgi:hypothetical protein